MCALLPRVSRIIGRIDVIDSEGSQLSIGMADRNPLNASLTGAIFLFYAQLLRRLRLNGRELFLRQSPHMRAARFVPILLCFLCVPSRLFAESLPEMRPALAGSAPNSLVNLIDGQALMKKGIQHGAVFFRCLVHPSGSTAYRIAYGGTPGSEPLRLEVKNKLYPAKFIPAVYNLDTGRVELVKD